MWVVILYVCVTQGCGFIDSPPVHSEAECQAMLVAAADALQADDSVRAFDGACVRIQMSQV
jgi:hypothetical protein